MKVVPERSQEWMNVSTFNVDNLVGLFAGEREKRWPQGWSGAQPEHLRMDMGELAERAAQENLREFTWQGHARWPLQGWCKEDNHSNVALSVSCKTGGQSRWPQGW